jgi:integrase
MMGAIMAKLDLKFIKQYRDRHGVMRHYFRRAGRTYGALPGRVGSPEFMEAYQAFLGAKPSGRSMAAPGTIGALVKDYYRSAEYKNLKPNSRKTYASILEPLAAKHGHKHLSLLTRDVAKRMIEDIGDKHPAMANLTQGVLSRVFTVTEHHVNPFTNMTPYKTGTHHTWTETELLAYEARWPLGTRQRLAYALLLYTGQRVGDVVRMHRRDVVDGMINLVQEKTDAALQIPIHSELHRAMQAMPAQTLFLFAGVRGGAVARGDEMSKLIREAVAAAGLPARCKAHGLRKAVMRRLAEGGASAKQMAAVSGHKTLKEVERYTAAASQPKLAKDALLTLGVSNPRGKSV